MEYSSFIPATPRPLDGPADLSASLDRGIIKIFTKQRLVQC